MTGYIAFVLPSSSHWSRLSQNLSICHSTFMSMCAAQAILLWFFSPVLWKVTFCFVRPRIRGAFSPGSAKLASHAPMYATQWPLVAALSASRTSVPCLIDVFSSENLTPNVRLLVPMIVVMLHQIRRVARLRSGAYEDQYEYPKLAARQKVVLVVMPERNVHEWLLWSSNTTSL